MEIITSVANKNIKFVRGLKSKKGRDESGCFIAEGEKFVAEIAPPWQIDFIMSSAAYKKAVPHDAAHYKVSEHVFAAISDVVQPQGVLAVVRKRDFALAPLLAAQNPLLLMLEDMQDPGNLGAVLRIAHGLGFCGVILSGGCVDVYSPKVVRASAGSIFHMPFVTAELPQAAAALKVRGIRIFAASARARQALYKLDFRGPTAFLLGNEAKGLSGAAMALADCAISIPINSESLNAAVAYGILAYEAHRQRNLTHGG